MKGIYLLLIFVLLYHVAAGQVTESVSSNNAASLDSTALTAAGIAHITMDTTQVVVLSATDTALMAGTDSTSSDKKTCVISFIGCDEAHRYTSEFMNYFYSEYLEKNNNEIAFLNAKKYLFNKYPDSPVTPVLNCKK